MPTITDTIHTPDGDCPVTLAIPDGSGPWPAVVMYPDAGGARPVFTEMASRLAGYGYAVLVPRRTKGPGARGKISLAHCGWLCRPMCQKRSMAA